MQCINYGKFNIVQLKLIISHQAITYIYIYLAHLRAYFIIISIHCNTVTVDPGKRLVASSTPAFSKILSVYSGSSQLLRGSDASVGARIELELASDSSKLSDSESEQLVVIDIDVCSSVKAAVSLSMSVELVEKTLDMVQDTLEYTGTH